MEKLSHLLFWALAMACLEGAAAEVAALRFAEGRASSQFAPMPVSQDTMDRTRGRIHTKLVMAKAMVQGGCREGASQPCGKVLELLDILVDESRGVEPYWGFLSHVRYMLGLTFWLYHPGPPWCFYALDKDGSGSLAWKEFEQAFAQPDVMVRMFTFIDSNSDNQISKKELVDYLKAAVNVRELVPEVDEVDPQASFDTSMGKVETVLQGPRKKERFSYGLRLLFILGLCLVIFGTLYLYCRRREPTRHRMPQPTEKDGK
jgi:hypothetical protein